MKSKIGREPFDFGTALKMLEDGKCVARKGWNGKGMYVVKHDLYIQDSKFTPHNIKIDNECLCLYNVKGQYNTWIPSITDLFAKDWDIAD